MAPFVVFAMPRCRTAWLARLLSYGEWSCGHDELRHARSLGDVRTWLSQPCTGTVETAAAAHWRLATHYQPGMRVVVVKRPVDDVVASLLRAGLGTDRDLLTREISRLDVKLGQIAARVHGALQTTFAELATEDGCARVFEHCLPYQHDAAWWRLLEGVNIQVDLRALVRYIDAFRSELNKLAAQAKQRALALMSPAVLADADGITISQEPFAQFFADSTELFAEHCVQIGEDPYAYLTKNLALMQRLDDAGALQVMVARCNGRPFGYLMTVVGPSLESPDTVSASHATFFASSEFPGLGLKLQRAAIAALKIRGAGEVFMRAGVRGGGPKMGALYRRIGAEEFGQMYRLELAEAF